MPEHEAPIQAFYDHETEEPRGTGRRRRQVADWGVGEDVFDRLPARRFARGEHRSTARADDTRPRGRGDDLAGRRPPTGAAEAPLRGRRDDLAEAPLRGRRDDLAEAPLRGRGGDLAGRRPATGAGGHREDLTSRRSRRRPAADWLEEVSPRPADERDGLPMILAGEAAEGELAAPPEDGQASGGALEPDVAPRAEAPRPRRTVVIGGHPDRLPTPRPRRPPRTALDRVGASPDRLAAYAVALGLLLILIAVLTTSH